MAMGGEGASQVFAKEDGGLRVAEPGEGGQGSSPGLLQGPNKTLGSKGEPDWNNDNIMAYRRGL